MEFYRYAVRVGVRLKVSSTEGEGKSHGLHLVMEEVR